MAKKDKDEKQTTPQVPLTKKEEQELLIKQIEKTYGKGSITLMGRKAEKIWTFRPSGSLALDIALGGGWARGAAAHIYGPQSAGKTTTAILALAEAQQVGEEIAIVDPEQAFNITWARTLGLYIPEDENDPYPDGYGGVWFHQPTQHAEVILDYILFLIEQHKFGIIALDSIPALITKAEMDGEMEDSTVASLARIVARGIKKIIYSGKLRESGTTLLFLNQVRDKIGFMAKGTDTTGGRSLKHAVMQGADISAYEKLEAVIEGEKRQIGQKIRCEIKRNKCAPPYRVAEFSVYYENGFDRLEEVVSLGLTLKIIDQAGAWYSYIDRVTGELIFKAQGREAFKQAMVDDPEKYIKLMANIQAIIRS